MTSLDHQSNRRHDDEGYVVRQLPLWVVWLRDLSLGLFVLGLVMWAVMTMMGCQKQAGDAGAAEVHQQQAIITHAAEVAAFEIRAADDEITALIKAAGTSNPADTLAALNRAHKHNLSALNALEPIAPAVEKTGKAADDLATAVAKAKDEQWQAVKWWGSIIVGLLVAGLVTFAVEGATHCTLLLAGVAGGIVGTIAGALFGPIVDEVVKAVHFAIVVGEIGAGVLCVGLIAYGIYRWKVGAKIDGATLATKAKALFRNVELQAQAAVAAKS